MRLHTVWEVCLACTIDARSQSEVVAKILGHLKHLIELLPLTPRTLPPPAPCPDPDTLPDDGEYFFI